MKTVRIVWPLLFVASFARAQTATAPYTLVAHSDSQYARELSHLKQTEVIQSQLAQAKGTPAENLWKSQLLQLQFDELAKGPAGINAVTNDYLNALNAYVKSQDRGLDGGWALDHAQFILSHLSQPIITRMEYFGESPRDRQMLAPQAAAADELLKIATRSLDAEMKALEAAKPFDEKSYNRAYGGAAEARYYGAWSAYFQAMALGPSAANRGPLLAQATTLLNEWAVETPDNGVNYQSYLLRGKTELQAGGAGDFAKALADFVKAQSDKAPSWVQYQARFQAVVANLRSGDVFQAQSSFDAFKHWIPKDNAEAMISADVLGFRVAWAAADKKADASEKRRAQRDALQNLGTIIDRDPRFRDLVYEQLAAQIPENADLKALFPMQQLAMARVASLNQKGDTPESKKQLTLALTAAAAAKENPLSNNPDKLEATFLLGVCNALLGSYQDAVKYEVDFATGAQKDPRAKQMVDLALQQIGELRKAAATGGAGGGGLSPEIQELAGKALDLSINTFGDTQWLYARGRLYEEAGKTAEAAAVYEKIPLENRNYLDARYRMVALATERFSALSSSNPPAPARQQKEAATALFSTCAAFSDLLDHPPASAPPETLKAAQGYRYSIWLIEAATAVAPAVRDCDVALDRLGKLDSAKDKLTPPQKASTLRYQVQAYQLAGKPDKAKAALDAYVKTGPDALADVRGMALAATDEIDKTTDAAEVKRLAAGVVMLLDPIVQAAAAEGKADSAFEYRLIQADMMARAGQYAEAQALSVKLQGEKKDDIRTFMAEARAMFAQAQSASDVTLYAKSQDYWMRILARVAPGSEAFWESWLRIIQSMEGQTLGGSISPEIKSRLGDLKTIYGAKFGGEHFKGEFEKLAGKYGV